MDNSTSRSAFFRHISAGIEKARILLIGSKEHKLPYISDEVILQTLQKHNAVMLVTRQDMERNEVKLQAEHDELKLLKTSSKKAEQLLVTQGAGLCDVDSRLRVMENTIQALQGKLSGLGELEGMVSRQGEQIVALQEVVDGIQLQSSERFEANKQILLTVETRLRNAETMTSRLETRVDRLKEELFLPACNITLPLELHAQRFVGDSPHDKKVHLLTHLLGTFQDQLESHETSVEFHNARIDEHAIAIAGKAKIDLEEIVRAHSALLDRVQAKINADADCDIPGMLADLKQAEEQIKSILDRLQCKVSYDDLDSGIEKRYVEILSYLQSSLHVTEVDEKDLRRETNALQNALNEVRMSKADRGDLAQLRSQVASQESKALEAIEINALAEELELRPKRSEVHKLLASKVSFADLQKSDTPVRPMPNLSCSGALESLASDKNRDSPKTGCTKSKGAARVSPKQLHVPVGYQDLCGPSLKKLLPVPQQCLSCDGFLKSPINDDDSVGAANVRKNAHKTSKWRTPYVSALPPPTLPRMGNRPA